MRVPDFRQWLVAGDFASAYRYAVGVAAQPAAITNKSMHQVDRNITALRSALPVNGRIDLAQRFRYA
jgi:hypothetical protein